jgi:hypothetical protein
MTIHKQERANKMEKMNFGYKRRTYYSYIEKNIRKCPVNEKLGLKILKRKRGKIMKGRMKM